ncbi:hypothetical protein V8E54_007744 [Elaphomyces granulatus]
MTRLALEDCWFGYLTSQRYVWGAEYTEEVSFKDMMDGIGRRKTGYDKIRFCEEQARRDGLQYFWIDTCCIDKSSSAELRRLSTPCFAGTVMQLNATCI